MQTFGSGFNIVVGTSSSLATGSISTGSFLQAINFVYLDPRYTSSLATGSIASFEPVISNVSRYGANGYLTVKLPDIADSTVKTPNKEAIRFFISGGEARVGIGFDTDKDDPIPQFPLDVKSSKDNAEGTKFVLRHTRPTKGADPGDSAGKIIFTIDSGSYRDLESSGSAGSIESDVIDVDATGVTGDIIVKTAVQKTDAPAEVFRVNGTQSNFSSSLRVQGNQLTVDNTVVANYGRMDSLRIGPAAVSPGDNNAYIDGELNVNTSFTASGLNYPDIDGLDRQVMKTDGNGNLSFGYSENVEITVKNVSGGSIPKGTPCYITASGTSGNVAGIIPADAGDLSTMPAGIIAGETLADEAEGVGLINGFIQGVDTSAFSSGDTVYVAVGGGYTNVKPTGSGVYIQKLGNVEKVDNTNGSGVIYGPGYYNDLPNWEEGKIMVGTTTYPSISSVITLDESNSKVTITNTLDTVTLNADKIEVGKSTSAGAGAYGYGSRVLTNWDTGLSLTKGNIYFWNSSGAWTAADASAESTSKGLLAVASDTGGAEMVKEGVVYIATSLSGFTAGNPVYLSTTSGEITKIPPTGSGEVVRIIGHVIDVSRNTIYFNPSNDYSVV